MTTRNRPLFGVFTTSKPRGNEPSAGWKQLERFAYEAGLRACWFTPRDAHMRQGRITAWVCDRTASGGRTWRRAQLNLPAVVYENVPVPVRNRDDVLRLKQYFRQRGIPFFNPPLGTKPQLGKWLTSYPALYRHHPETRFHPTPADVPALLQRHRSVYLKPYLGRGGYGIIEISKSDVPTAPYRVRSSLYGAQRKSLDRHLSRAELLTFVQNEFRRNRYLLQAGIDLLKIDSCKIDIRAHMQRDGEGQWQCVGLVVKQGKANAIVTNYHLGGALHTWEWLQIRAKAQNSPLPTEQQVNALAKKIAAAYSAKAPHLGCLGFDLGIDTAGRVWLLDINSPPSRSLLRPEGRRRSHQLIAEFAAYLARRNVRRKSKATRS